MTERLDAIKELHRSGWTLQRIGVAFDLSRERIRQILEGVGLSRLDGGQTVINIERKKKRLLIGHNEKRERVILEIYGCSHARLIELNDNKHVSDSSGRAFIYLNQRKNSINRGIGWEMTFPEWCQVWDESGKWALRGRTKGSYCMSRLGDSGPYRVDNVAIVEMIVNIREGYAARGIVRDELGLSKAERRVHDLLSAGHRNCDVAKLLGLTNATVGQYRTNIKRLLTERKAA